MGHDLLFASRSRLVVNLHGVIAVSTLDLTLALNLLLQLFLALVLEVDTAIIRGLIVFLTLSGSFGAIHSGITISVRGFGLLFGRSLLSRFLLALLSTVLLLVTLQIGLRLLRGELGWSRSFRVPDRYVKSAICVQSHMILFRF